MTTIDNLQKKETNQQQIGEESAAVHLINLGWLPSAAQNNRALRNSSASGGLKQSSRLICYFSAARLREMAFKN